MTFKTRLAALEKVTGGGGMAEVQITGGMPGPAPGLATIDGTVLRQREAETAAAFRARTRAEAAAIGARAIVFGGLPP